MVQPLLKLDEVHVRYGLVTALRGVSLTVNEGEMVALLGPNGAGKSTTLRAIAGLARPHSGQVLFGDQRIDGMQAWDVVKLGVAQMPEGRYLFGGLSVEENLRFAYLARNRGRARYRELLDEAYASFPRLRERRRQAAGTLSGGEQQMLTASMALISEPRLLLVDELSLGLAPKVVDQLFEVLRRANQRGCAILLVEQFVPLALANTSRGYVLAKGAVVMSRPSAELLKDPSLVSSYLGEAVALADAGTGAKAGLGAAEVEAEELLG